MAVKRLVRPVESRKIAGVAIGIANYLNVDVTVIRIIWILLLIPGGMPGLILYVIFCLAIPEDQ